MVIGICQLDLLIGDSHSLKGKRRVLKQILARVKNKFNVSIAEVGDHDLWQRARVLIVLGASSPVQAGEQLDELDRYLHAQAFEVERVVLKTVDPVGAMWDFDA